MTTTTVQQIDLTDGDTYQNTLAETVFTKEFPDKLTTVYIDRHTTGQYFLVWDDWISSGQIFGHIGAALFYLLNHGHLTEDEYFTANPTYYQAQKDFTITGLPNDESFHVKKYHFYAGILVNENRIELLRLKGANKGIDLKDNFKKCDPEFYVDVFYPHLHKFSILGKAVYKNRSWELFFLKDGGVTLFTPKKAAQKDIVNDLRTEVANMMPELETSFHQFMFKQKLV